MSSGIYAVVNTKSGEFYVGSSVDLDKRWEHHRYALRKGARTNPPLQALWDDRSEEEFEFQVLGFIPAEELRQTERRLLGNLVGHPKCLNIRVKSTLNVRGWQPEAGEAARQATLGKPRPDFSAITRKLNRERIWTPESRERVRKQMLGSKRPEVGKKIGAKLKGRVRSPEECRKISEGRKRYYAGATAEQLADLKRLQQAGNAARKARLATTATL